MTEIQYHLSAFDGPLDLLLHLISKNKVNIYDIPVAEILEQYDAALANMEIRDLDLESEFVAMSAQLLYIKSKMLLPRHEENEEEDDPRATLVQMLLEYQKFKEVSGLLSTKYEVGRDIFVKEPECITPDKSYRFSHNKTDLSDAIVKMLDRADHALPPPVSNFTGIVGREIYSVSAKVAFILKRILNAGKVGFKSLFTKVKTRSEVVATFLAVLELCKSGKIKIGEENDPEISLTEEE
ncbi:MAG: segregation/condensation protein A [Clostridia bacterium]|nr:segregation/condensation protein A [Clostridia bacterium]